MLYTQQNGRPDAKSAVHSDKTRNSIGNEVGWDEDGCKRMGQVVGKDAFLGGYRVPFCLPETCWESPRLMEPLVGMRLRSRENTEASMVADVVTGARVTP